MTSTAARRQRQVEPDAFSSAILSSSTEIRELTPLVRRFIRPNDVLFDPDFFLSSVAGSWRPRVVAVYNHSELAGVVYAKEKIVFGRRLGVIYADLSLGSVLFGSYAQQPRIFRKALETLLASPGIRGMRLRIPRGGPEMLAVRELIASKRLDVHFMRVKDHANLSLPKTYEQLLQRFGGTTRRNFRHYRRRFESAGHTYWERLSLEELRSAASYLRTRCSIKSRTGPLERILDMVNAAERPLAAGLKHRNGEWLGVVGGVYRPGAAVLFLQLNDDRNFSRDSLSVVLRGYLIESLIREGIRECTFWAGTSAPLSHYVRYISTLGIHLDLPNFEWRLARGLVSAFEPWLPQKFRYDARWIAPFQNRYLAG